MKFTPSILLAVVLAALCVCAGAPSFEGVRSAQAATTPGDTDLVFRRYRGDDEVSEDDRGGRGRGRGRGRGGDDQDTGSGGGGGRDKSKGGGGGGSGKQGGGKSNPNDSGDRFSN